MAPLVMDVIFALEIGGFTSYNAESCKININHSSTYKTTYMKVNKLKKKVLKQLYNAVSTHLNIFWSMRF